MIDFIAKYFYYIFLGLIILTVIQRRYRGIGDRKRMATLVTGILFLIMYIGAMVIKSKNLGQIWIILPLIIDFSLLYVLKSQIFVFKKECLSCGKALGINDILYVDSNLCIDCNKLQKTADYAEENNEDKKDISPE